jgi:hypothetical protein
VITTATNPVSIAELAGSSAAQDIPQAENRPGQRGNALRPQCRDRHAGVAKLAGDGAPTLQANYRDIGVGLLV